MSRGTKLVLLGDSSVGKTSIVAKRTLDTFNAHTDSTIGAAFKSLEMKNVLNHGEHHDIRFEIWDTAGQERYQSLAPMYYRNANCAIVVYDITNNESYVKATDWVGEVIKKSTASIVIALVGNKLDLVDETLGGNKVMRKVETDVAQDFSEANGILFWEASAKEGVNINEVFRGLAERVPLDNKAPRHVGAALEDSRDDQPQQSSCTC